MTTNFDRTKAWLTACGKEQTVNNLSVQIGCHIEEFIEFVRTLEFSDPEMHVDADFALADLEQIALRIKQGKELATIPMEMRAECLDSLCDMDVTGNGVAYLASFNKNGADAAVLDANDAKLVDGKPVILEGGKIGKPAGWSPADIFPFI